jgi:hypothetical protein
MLWTNLPGDASQFLTSSLFAIAITVAARLRNEGRSTSGNGLIGFAVFAYGIALLRHYGLVEPSAASLLVTLIGFAFGSFTARFVWGLIGPDFSAKDALMAAVGLVLISIAYSLQVYYRDFSLILHGFSISSLKTPVAEVTFAERPDRHGAQGVGELAGPVFSSGVPHPSDPTPALYYLTRDLSTDKEEGGYRPWDRDYIAFFNPPGKPAIYDEVWDPRDSLIPLSKFSKCLDAYVKRIKDSHLMVIDIQPVLLQLFGTISLE